jgi:hypothetical protein
MQCLQRLVAEFVRRNHEDGTRHGIGHVDAPKYRPASVWPKATRDPSRPARFDIVAVDVRLLCRVVDGGTWMRLPLDAVGIGPEPA